MIFSRSSASPFLLRLMHYVHLTIPVYGRSSILKREVSIFQTREKRAILNVYLKSAIPEHLLSRGTEMAERFLEAASERLIRNGTIFMIQYP